MKASTAIAVLVAVALVAPPAGQASRPCGDAVVSDWADGHIDGRYAPRCYGDALDGLPEDVRAYSTAADDIAQALRARIRETRRGPGPPGAAPTPAGDRVAAPIPLLSGAAIGIVLAVAALGAVLARRLGRERVPHRDTRPLGQW
jgi:hypothetical protein